MFRTTTPTEPAPVEVDPSDLIPITHLALDLPEPPAGGWVAYLTGRGIEVVTDDIGRPAIARADARQLLDEQRENEVRKREPAAAAEAQALEADRLWRSRLWGGQPWYAFPDGVSPAEAWAQAEKDARPRRRSVLEDALSNSGTTLHIIGPTPDEQ